MPPTNDNFVSATVLSGVFGQVSGTNIGATAQVGEPISNSKTVWFKYTPTAFRSVFFSTLYNSTLGDVTTPLRTVVRVYTGATVNALTQSNYVVGAGAVQGYASWDFGSYVAVNLIANTTYYIRVDGVNSTEGNFSLTWGDYFPYRLGSCSACPPQWSVGYECRGTVQSLGMGSVFNLSFGTQPKARYVVSYCGGAFMFIAEDPRWTVDLRNDPNFSETHSPWWNIRYVENGNPATKLFSNIPSATYYTQAEAEAAFRCMQATLNHDGGNISLDFFDFPTTDNLSGNPNPTFGLYKITPVFRAATACASWVVKGTSATCTFTIQNLTNVDWDSMTVTLLGSGGVSSPSAAQTGVTIAAGGNRALTYTFNTATPNVTATLSFASPFFNTFTLGYFLGPILTVTGVNGPFGPGGCSGKKWLFNVVVTNTGFWTITPTAAVSINNGLQLLNPACARSSSLNITAGFLLCATGRGGPAVDVLAPAVDTAATLTITITDTGFSSGPFTQQITVPA